MRIKFNRTGSERKALVEAIGDALQVKPKYMGMPSASYQVDYFTIDKEGTLEFDERADSEKIENLLETLAGKGFVAAPAADTFANEEVPAAAAETFATAEETTAAAETTASGEITRDNESVGLTLAMPAECVNIANLEKILQAKGKLIKKALGISDLSFEEADGKIIFPWFDDVPDAERSLAYTKFIEAVCRLSKESKRITAKERDVENEKYAFRCFLLRLGMIGDAYKADRRILLKNLDGSAAFKNGAKRDEVGDVE